MKEERLLHKWWPLVLAIGMTVLLFDLGVGFHLLPISLLETGEPINLTDLGQYDIEGRIDVDILDDLFHLDQEIFEGRDFFVSGNIGLGDEDSIDFLLELSMSEMKTLVFTLEGRVEEDGITIKDNLLLAHEVTLPIDYKQWIKGFSEVSELGNYICEENGQLKVYRPFYREKHMRDLVWQVYYYLDVKGSLSYMKWVIYDSNNQQLLEVYGYPRTS